MQCAKCNKPVGDGGYIISVELLPARERKDGALCAECFDLPADLKPEPDDTADVVEEAKQQALAAAKKKEEADK